MFRAAARRTFKVGTALVLFSESCSVIRRDILPITLLANSDFVTKRTSHPTPRKVPFSGDNRYRVKMVVVQSKQGLSRTACKHYLFSRKPSLIRVAFRRQSSSQLATQGSHGTPTTDTLLLRPFPTSPVYRQDSSDPLGAATGDVLPSNAINNLRNHVFAFEPQNLRPLSTQHLIIVVVSKPTQCGKLEVRQLNFFARNSVFPF